MLTWIIPQIAVECPAICQWHPLKWLAAWLVTGIAPCGWVWALSTHMVKRSQTHSVIMDRSWSLSVGKTHNYLVWVCLQEKVGPHRGLMAPATSKPVLLLNMAHARSRCVVIRQSLWLWAKWYPARQQCKSADRGPCTPISKLGVALAPEAIKWLQLYIVLHQGLTTWCCWTCPFNLFSLIIYMFFKSTVFIINTKYTRASPFNFTIT